MKNPVSHKEIVLVFEELEKTHPLTMLEELAHYTPYQLLVMTMLSARTKDATTIPIAINMFETYPEPKHIATLSEKQIQSLIYGVGFHRAKAKNLKQLSIDLVERFNSTVPRTLEELTSLPGVGRKTANCVLAYVFNIPAIAVDIHVHRIANRLGWIHTTKPEQSEEVLAKIVPKEQWININRLLVGHGQSICRPIGPQCEKCNITKYCQFYQKNKK